MIMQPVVSIMESEWFRGKALYDRLCKDMVLNDSITVGEWKDNYEKFLKALRNHNASEYLKQRIIYITFLEVCDDSKIADTALLNTVAEHLSVLVKNTLEDIMSWSEEECK